MVLTLKTTFKKSVNVNISKLETVSKLLRNNFWIIKTMSYFYKLLC